MNKSNKSPLAIAIGSSLVSGLTSTAIQAETSLNIEKNPFEMAELSAGYMQTAEAESGSGKMKDGACGEGKCGSAMQKGSEEKTAEGKCAGNKPMPKASESDKNKEAKCGEGKCGSSIKM
ncbi:MAG: hypothetical protein HF967_01065 [Methanosarcinales archaeon]|jgi:uncharacterized low-complexity protein|nr:hypothetical protein [Methanosarcinales archaeon]